MTTIGVLGGRWRATVSATGTIEPWDGSQPLRWFIAGDDRWYVPAHEPTIRQRLIDGTPVVETRLRVPDGDAVHRVWCVAEGDGFTVVEIENDSSLPFAVAFDRGDLLSARPATDVPIQGIDLPGGSMVFPVGHRSTLRVALAHTAPAAGRLPDRLPSALQVARGWTAVIDRAGRLLLPDDAVVAEIATLRSDLALMGPVDPDDDPVGFLIDVGQLVRLGERAEPWVEDIADAVPAVARATRSWDVDAAFDAAAVVLAKADERRALRDLARLRSPASLPLPSSAPANRTLLWHEQRMARTSEPGSADLLGAGIPATWLGANFEVYGMPVGPATTVSYAVRWHGDRPAVLWELDGPRVALTASVVAPQWSSAEEKGEALWPAPIVAGTAPFPAGPDVSFS